MSTSNIDHYRPLFNSSPDSIRNVKINEIGNALVKKIWYKQVMWLKMHENEYRFEIKCNIENEYRNEIKCKNENECRNGKEFKCIAECTTCNVWMKIQTQLHAF